MDKKLYIKPPLVDRSYDWRKGPQPKTRRALDAFFRSTPIRRVKQAMCEMGRRIYARGFTDGNGGNLSVRVGEDLVLCSPTLCCKGFMEERDICLVDMAAGQLCGYRPRTSEVKVSLPRNVSGAVRKGAPPSFHLPVVKPDVEIPVIECILK